MDKKIELIDKYKIFREIPDNEKRLKKDFLKFCQINETQLTKIFGRNAYATLQTLSGDKPNKLEMKRTSINQILEQYGQLVRRHQRAIVTSDWIEAGFRPNIHNLRKIHSLKWGDMQPTFLEHNADNINWKDVVGILKANDHAPIKNKDKKFAEIVHRISTWTPDRKRIVEEGYKIELRKYLEQFYDIEEEAGDTNTDLLVNKKYPIEIKKDPTLSEYDRLLGQIIRHNKQYGSAIAIVTSLSSQDRFIRFQKLFIEISNKLSMKVEIIKK
jgi:hypothetical protein